MKSDEFYYPIFHFIVQFARCVRAPRTVWLCKHEHESGKANKLFWNCASVSNTDGCCVYDCFFVAQFPRRSQPIHTHEPSDTCTTRSLHIQYIQTKLCYEFNEIAFVLTRQRERANNSQWRTETTAPLYIKIVSAGLRCRFTFTAYSLFTAFIPVFVQNPTQWSAGWMWSERITIFPTDFVFYLLFHLRLRGAHYDYESAIYFSLFIYIFIVLRIGLKWIKFIKWKRKSV